MSLKFSKILCLLVSIHIILSCNSVSTNGNNPAVIPVAPQEKTIFAIYMVGGDLEDDIKPRNGEADEKENKGRSTIGAGSSDFREMVAAYTTLSNQEKENLEVIVGFGGARKEGWQGIKYADIQCILQDSQDKYFGNDSCYLFQEDARVMAQSQTLSDFLNYIDKNYSNYGRKVLNIWNHGLAYLGTGYDTTSPEEFDYVTLPELKQAFSQTQIKFDLIGFDACLMASLEVVGLMKEYADYIVASEELEPAHGWNYTDVLTILAKNPKSSFRDIGKQFVDSFMDSPKHTRLKKKYKTLSVIDLSRVTESITAVDQFVSQLKPEQFDVILEALVESQRYGEEPLNDVEYTIDLIDWIKRLKVKLPAISEQGVLQALREMIVYSRHDHTKPDSNGISIFSLNEYISEMYGNEQSISSSWLSFTNNFITQGTSDSESPIISIDNFSTQQLDPSGFCQQKDKPGHCFSIKDNLGLKHVEQVFALKANEQELFMIGSEKLKSGLEKNYFAPVWDGEWFLVCNGDCKTSLSLFPAAYYNSTTETGTKIYTSEAILNGENVLFYMEVGLNNMVVDEWAVPYVIGKNKEIIITRNQLEIKKGDTLAFYYQVYNLQTKTIRWQKGENLAFNQKPEWSFAQINAPRTYYVKASDYKGNLSNSDIFEVKSKSELP